MSMTTHDDTQSPNKRTKQRPAVQHQGGKRASKRRAVRHRVRLPYWVCAITKYQQENLAAKNCEQQGLRVLNARYVPDNKKWTLAPLFPGYLFVQIPRDRDCGFLLNTRGIVGVIGTGDKWDKVPDGAIEDLQRLQDEEGIIVLPHRRKLVEGETVEINSGSFKNIKGVYIEDTPNERIKMLFEFMGNKIPYEIERHKVTPVQK